MTFTSDQECYLNCNLKLLQEKNYSNSSDKMQGYVKLGSKRIYDTGLLYGAYNTTKVVSSGFKLPSPAFSQVKFERSLGPQSSQSSNPLLGYQPLRILGTFFIF